MSVLELEDVTISHRKFDDNGEPLGKWKHEDRNIPVSAWFVSKTDTHDHGIVLDFYVGRRNVELILTKENLLDLLGLV